MKRSIRITVLACVFMLCASTMYGGTLLVPWFQDSGSSAVDPLTLVPVTGQGDATYIKVQNITAGTLLVTVDFYGIGGLIHTNTGNMTAKALWAWRPHQGQGIAPPNGGVVTGTVMSAIISWPGGTNADLVGNVITINEEGSRLGMNLIAP